MRSYQNHNCGVSCLQPYTSNHINHLISLMNTVMEERIVFHLHLYSPLSSISSLMPFWRKGVSSFLLIFLEEGSIFSVNSHILWKAPTFRNMLVHPLRSPHSSNHSSPRSPLHNVDTACLQTPQTVKLFLD